MLISAPFSTVGSAFLITLVLLLPWATGVGVLTGREEAEAGWRRLAQGISGLRQTPRCCSQCLHPPLPWPPVCPHLQHNLASPLLSLIHAAQRVAQTFCSS